MPRFTNTTTTSVAGGSSNLMTALPLDVIRTNILNKLDGVTLASTSCVSSQLLSLCNDDQLWRKICNSTWPSTTDPRIVLAISSHRSFYSDSFLSTSHQLPRLTCVSDTSKLISAVDIYYKDQVIYSKVSDMETVSNPFFSNPFKIRLLGPKETVPTPLKSDGHDSACTSLAKEHLRVSWIIVDTNNKRAVNVASQKVLEMRRLTNEIVLRYPTVATLATGRPVKFAVAITCGWMGRELHVKQVRMQIMDIFGITLDGRKSLGILQATMEGRRRRIDCKREKHDYTKFLRKKEQFGFSAAFEKACALYIVIIIILLWVIYMDSPPKL